MQDKITFGKFIQSKRKEAGISQKVLAERLYVTESAVSKWERGISYPDITMISEICSALNITEHELCTASDDENQRKIVKMAKKYKLFIAVYNAILALGYLSAIIPCFIIFILKEHNTSKFCILLTSLMLSASLLNVPTFAAKNRGILTLASSYVSLTLLLLSGNVYSGGDWFFMAFLSVTLGLCIVFLPFIIRCDFISKYIGNNKSLICMAADTAMILAVVAYGTLKYGVWESFVTGMVSAACVLVLVWAIFAVIRYAKINIFLKSSAVLAMLGAWLLSAEKLALHFLPSNVDFSITINDDVSTAIVSAFIIGLAGISAAVGLVFKYRR
ncbi:MAG: helix-turn-helix domain-containing protein [Ruminococcus flavefaciens]|nr:helix-turn-helix domain-containing protein [Ruminococcus flavefaciens]MCM1361164.1 helix-turn-helix domain-containing protein [Clostridiales bacterium]MCM1434656.1 helix-turn-helix domain-containing protein [Ruminococcus flavefaciens]